MEKKNWPFYLKALSVLIIFAAALVAAFSKADIQKNPASGYDERMWTGASIASYEMFFNDYLRQNVQPDVQWFYRYTNKYADQLQRQYGMKKPATTYDIDPDAMPAEEAQWFDGNMWTFGWKAPAIGKYIMGWNVIRHKPDSLDPQGLFYFDEKLNRIDNHASQQMIALARKPNAIMAALIVCLVLIIGWRYIHYSAGLAAALFLLLNDSFFAVNSIAGLDAPSIFFGTLSLLSILVWLENYYHFKNHYWLVGSAIAVGVFFPLAVGSKLNAALIGFVIAACFALLVFSLFSKKNLKTAPTEKRKIKQPADTTSSPWTKLIYSAAIMAILTYTLFTQLNPVFKSQPLEKVKLVQNSVDDFFSIRAKSMKESVKDDLFKSLELVIKRNFVLTGDLKNPDTKKYVYYGTIGSLLPVKFNFLDGLFIVGGLIVLLSRAFRKFSEDRTLHPYGVIGLFSLIIIYGNVRFIWVDWVRYHVSMYAVFALCFGAAVYFIIEWVSKKMAAKKSITAHSN